MFSEFPVAMITATRATSAHVMSARPDAPVVPDVERTRGALLVPVRAGLARVLHRTADRVAPARCVPSHA